MIPEEIWVNWNIWGIKEVINFTDSAQLWGNHSDCGQQWQNVFLGVHIIGFFLVCLLFIYLDTPMCKNKCDVPELHILGYLEFN